MNRHAVAQSDFIGIGAMMKGLSSIHITDTSSHKGVDIDVRWFPSPIRTQELSAPGEASIGFF